jgi:FkbM family methyltransferase
MIRALKDAIKRIVLIVLPNAREWRRKRKLLRDARKNWFLIYQPRRGDIIVDIGAGRGEDIYAFSRASGPAGRVWAIEAHPESFGFLARFRDENGLANVTALNLACMDKPGQLQIDTLPDWTGNFVRESGSSPASYPVEAIDFDGPCARHGIGRIDFLKMNIEGAERFALRGMREALGRIRHICICAHDFRAARGEGEEFRTFDLVVRTLEEAGFKLVFRKDHPSEYIRDHIHGYR